MKNTIEKLGGSLAAIVCIGFAGQLAILGVPGWGWFLAGGMVCVGALMICGLED